MTIKYDVDRVAEYDDDTVFFNFEIDEIATEDNKIKVVFKVDGDVDLGVEWLTIQMKKFEHRYAGIKRG